MSRILVTGIGIISPIGDNVDSNMVALQKGISGISKLELIDSRYSDSLPFGEIKTETALLKQRLNADDRGVTRTSLLALHAFQDALQSSGLSAAQIASYDTALIGATTVGGMCMTDELYNDANHVAGGSEYLYSYDMASTTMYLQSKSGIKGIVNTINTACSSSANAIGYGARLIKNGLAKRAIVGGADSLAKFTINGFNALTILSQEPCRPFDKDRKGLNLGEGAAFLVLEREEDCQGKKVYAEFSGFANTNDAFHPSSLSDQGHGPYLAMLKALESANLRPEQIDYINAHGTATENNDIVESTAILRLFQKDIAFSSTKSNTGHTLAAAGAIEAVYCILNLQRQELYPGLNFQNAIPETGLRPVGSNTKKSLQHIMSNSFGFGGNCSSVIFSKV